jgi:hypothetical protein
MKTENLIQLLVSDEKEGRSSLERKLLLALLIGFMAAAIPYWWFHGMRADIASAVFSPRFLFKVFELLLLAVAAGLLVLRLIRPGADTLRGKIGLVVPPVLLAVAVVIELFVVPAGLWSGSLVGSNYYVCIVSVFLLSLPLLVAALYVLRDGAPVQPGFTGAVAGLLAGGLAAFIYAIQCTDDSPLFVATWYTLSILAVAAVGSFAGHRALRW